MSSTSSAEIAQLVSVFSDINTSNFCVIAIIALLTYEWVITLGREVDLFWRDKISIAQVLFLMNRYVPIVYIAASFAGGTATDDASCNASVLASIALVELQYVPWALFSSLRVYAICGRRWYLAAPVLLFAGFPIVLNLLHYHWEHGELVPVLGCQSVSTVPPRLSKIFTIVSRSSLIMADALVVVTTWATTYSSVRRSGGHIGAPTFSRLLLVDGTIYFVILTMLNTMHLTFTMLSIATSLSQVSYIISFTEPTTAILVSRFMFSLQEVKRRTEHQQSLNSFHSSIDFDGVLGAIESTLQPEDLWPSNDEVPGQTGPEPHEHIGRIDSDAFSVARG
ncbi:hypothetical protein L227DRAFT_580888 [Lentinus tigrinus ALCF2SS1-6]|uniref:DUF6533 domain-containing protein n=1 Tax=Lentinus tigrinus ALCF2SS1-6 TaxID=1328759 RepID=A0A5C2RQR8_9APHY|nr:hypothetical protein L227DRAFT_580888 [Lentinus tigrinus ALCF2SS1-6]